MGKLVPKMALDRRLYSELRRLDRHDLRRVAIYVRGLLVALDDESVETEDPEHGVTYRLESVRCGKAGCRSCPHGPYWYAYFREEGRLRSRYIGRELPAGQPDETPR
ncbi:MAG TPA: hypothetical protein VG929_02510 [Actinomycetota bacterium]|nr:hypothetical protein [Actinomycetota bacterium]